ncbi:MAG: type II toxin-antitoxin system HicA family toxin [Saprospiraceae bacterium]|nr:type II toxin-antitoxin system HicA family toxin [Saprospiraceae bacterium]
MKLPRDISAEDLIRLLRKLGYEITRQTGSHIRLSCNLENFQYHITIPNHDPIKIGTLNSILNTISVQMNVSKEKLIEML